ncbi:MAG: TolC family protein [Gammaproteobacteria bacterium]|nr:TolC family protein [Gammaproteobacteria bacterium]
MAEAAPELLTLPEAVQLAVEAQPALAAKAATVRALRQEAVAEGQLPDPQLVGGIMQMPVTDDAAFSLRDDDFAALSLGVSQEFPRAAKRRLRGQRREQQAAAAELGLTGVEKRIRRDTGWAYLEVAGASAAARLVDDLAKQAWRQQVATEIGFTTGQRTQSEMLAASVEAEILVDRARAERQREHAARARLGRWIGPAADRPLPEALPSLPDPAPLESLVDGLSMHPLLAEPTATARVAATELKLAESQLQPDWRVEVRYDHRLEFSDLVTLMVGVDLPLFGAQRQDRRTLAARETLQASHAQRDDAQREITAQLTSAYRNWQAGRERLRRYDEALLPASHRRVAAALAGYQSGQVGLTALLDARRSLLEAELMRLDLQLAVTRERLALQYFDTEVGP